MTQKKLISSYKCNTCKDTGWVEGEDGVKYCDCAVKELTLRQWKAFGINPNTVKKINDFIAENDKQLEAKKIAIQYVKEFEEIKDSEENGLALLGQSGAGKTHLVVAIGAALVSKGYRVTYMPYMEAMSQLKANALDEYVYSRIVSKYKVADLLIIDDLFKDKLKNGKIPRDVKLNEADIKHLYGIINYRYANNLPIAVSSEGLRNTLIELDVAMAGRILERAKKRTVIFDSNKDNYRLKDGEI